MNSFLLDVIKTITGGLLLTLMLFLLNEFMFSKKNLTGEWKAMVKIEQTDYAVFKNLVIEFKIHLLQKGPDLLGSGEKVKDMKPDGTSIIYQKQKRAIINIQGYFEKKYLAKSSVFLNVTETGGNRETRTTYKLLYDVNTLIGTFTSTAANSKGSVILSRT